MLCSARTRDICYLSPGSLETAFTAFFWILQNQKPGNTVVQKIKRDMEKPYSEVKLQHRPHRIRYQENNSHSQHNTMCVHHIVFTFQCNFRVIAFQYFPSHCINRWDLKSLSRRRVSVSQRRRRARSLLPPFLEPNAGELLCQVLWAGDRLTPRLNEDNEKVKIDLLVITRFPAASHTHWEDNFR